MFGSITRSVSNNEPQQLQQKKIQLFTQQQIQQLQQWTSNMCSKVLFSSSFSFLFFSFLFFSFLFFICFSLLFFFSLFLPIDFHSINKNNNNTHYKSHLINIKRNEEKINYLSYEHHFIQHHNDQLEYLSRLHSSKNITNPYLLYGLIYSFVFCLYCANIYI